MTREEKIEAIYKEMANKELTFGCIAKHTTKDKLTYSVIAIGEMVYGEKYFVREDSLNHDVEGVYENDGTIEIIGHPVMIGDVLDWVSGRMFDTTKGGEDFLIDDDVVGYDYKLFSMRSKISSAVNIRRNYKRLPIEEQTDRCIDFIYSLIDR